MPTLTFTSSNDTYVVNAPGTYGLTFLAGDDTLTLQSAGATITADMGDGNDVVSHKAGVAEVLGGAGTDRFEIYVSGLTADGGNDADLFNIRGGSGLDLSGSLGVDRFNFYGAVGSILIHGGDGSDDFFGYNKVISGSIYGDAGNDYFVLFRSGVTLRGGIGNDIYRADAESPATFVENAGEGTDSVQVARGSDYALPSNIENISVSGFSGSNFAIDAVLEGNSLENTIIAHNNLDFITGLGGSDRLYGKGGGDDLHGGEGNDYLDGGTGDDAMYGDAGNDRLNGRLDDDFMAGGAGDDSYYVDSLADTVEENPGEGTDVVRSTVDDYALPANVEGGIVSGSANLTLIGNSLDNNLSGGAGVNDLFGMDGNDTLHGGDGGDDLHGGNGDDLLSGGDDGDFLYGEVGNDDLRGGAGDDFLAGHDGVDKLDGGPGADQMIGGEGYDSYYVDSPGDQVIDTGASVDWVYLGFTTTFYILPDNIEIGVLLSGADTDLYGNSLHNSLYGTAAADWLIGEAGNDDLHGYSGDDLLSGGEGDDFLIAESGDDFLWGGVGSDTLYGGAGVDTFYYGAVGDSSLGAMADDVADYVSGVDIIGLSDIDANTTVAGDQAFTVVENPTGAAGELWIVFDGVYTKLFGNVDSSAAAELQIDIRGAPADLIIDF